MDSSHLSRLAPELRNLIYSYALDDANQDDILEQEPAVMRTCRQVRSECVLIHYGRAGAFGLKVPRGESLDIAERLESRYGNDAGRTKIKAVRRVCIHYQLSSHETTVNPFEEKRNVEGGWHELSASLVRLGFGKNQVEWKAESPSFSDPLYQGNYFHFLAESARVRVVESIMRQGWESVAGSEEARL